MRLREYFLVSPDLGYVKKRSLITQVYEHPFHIVTRLYKNVRLIHVCDGRMLNQVETYLHERLRKIGVDVTLMTTEAVL